MDTSLFLRKWACRRMAANGLGIILFQYADWLQQKGYGRNTVHLYTQAVEHFGFWRAKRHPRSQSVLPSEVAEFLNSHLSRCGCPPPAATSLPTCRSALNRLMTMLGCGAPRCLLWVTLLGRLSLHSAARRLFKVESDINGILPAGGGPLPFISFLP